MGLLAWSLAAPAWAQVGGGTISGRVLDAKGEPVIGATILVPGTTKGAATDVDGNFTVRDVPAGTYKVTISSVGMNTFTQEVSVTEGGTASLSAAMRENATQLAEAVVVGYGTVKRQEITGSVATVDSKQFVQGQVSNPANLVVGKIAGVQVTPPSGAPGASAPIRIRGGSSLSGSNDPLIVIDGVPVDNRGLGGAPDVLSTINPNDIETFTVLKDASATAIYGSRASNGVILITTKKGLRGEKLSLNFNSQFSAAQNYRQIDVLSADQFRDFVNTNGNNAQKARLGTANTNWQDEIYRTAYTSDNNLSLTGSIAEKVPFRASLGYLNQQGTLRGGNFKRNSASIGVSPMLLDDHLRIDANIKGTWNDNVFANEGAIGAAVFFDPTQPIRSDDARFSPFGGFWQWTDANGRLTGLAPRNPVGLLEQNRNRSTVKRAIGNVQFDYKLHFLPDLRAVLNLGYDLQRGSGSQVIPADAASNFNVQTPANSGFINEYAEKKDNKLLDAYLAYSKDVVDGLRLDATAGYSYQDFRYRNPELPSSRFINGVLTTPAQPTQQAQDYGYTLLSWFGRANLNFKDRYILTGTIRNDRSSRFSPDNRSGYFPALAAAWRVKGEEFLVGSSVISDLKLRVGYGETGQQEIGNFYPYLARYRFGVPTVSYQLGTNADGTPIFVETLRPNGYNRDIKWETTTTYNAGLDYGFFDNRVYGAVDVYVRKTKDLIAFVDQPIGSNLTDLFDSNIGDLENRGVEAAINVVPIRNNDVTWTLNLNATYNKQEITNLNTQIFVGGISGGTGRRAQIHTQGSPASTFYLFQQLYDDNGKPRLTSTGAPIGVDADGADGFNAEDDRVPMKQWQPKVFAAFSSNLAYKKLNLAWTLRSQWGGWTYRNLASASSYNQAILQPNWIQNATPDVLTTGFRTDASQFSDYYLQKSDFIRLDNITLSYNHGAIGSYIKNVGASIAVQNALLITDYQGADPEVFGGIDNNFYPRPRIYTLGVNASF